ncbi:MAG: hypothetical protein ABF293_08440 [Flavobacteriaceae bacterium]
MGKISKEEGFKTPQGYFEGLSEEIMSKLEKASFDLPESDGFKTPEGYFDSLSKEVLAKNPVAQTRVIRLKPYKKLLFAAASVAAAVVLIFGWQWQGNRSLEFGDIASGELLAYFEDYSTGLSSYEIAEVIPIEDLELNDILERNLDDENIVDYLETTIDDIDELNLDYDE